MTKSAVESSYIARCSDGHRDSTSNGSLVLRVPKHFEGNNFRYVIMLCYKMFETLLGLTISYVF